MHKKITVRVKNKPALAYIKDFAKNNTSLFTAICSTILAVTTVYLKLCYFSYNYGMLAYFNINVNTVKLINDGNIFNVLFYMLVAATMLIMNYIGYCCYRKNSLLKYFCFLFPISLIVSFFLFNNTSHINFEDLFKNLEYCIAIFITAILIIPLSNIAIIITALFPTVEESFYRLENKLAKIEKNKDKCIKFRVLTTQRMLTKSRKLLLKQKVGSYNKQRYKKDKSKNNNLLRCFLICKNNDCNELIEQNINDIQKNIRIYKEELENKENKYNSYRITDPIKMGSIIILIFALIVFSFFVSGYDQGKNTKTIDIVESTTCFSAKSIDCATIYENDEYMILSPCYIKDDELYINTLYQYRISTYKINKHTMSFQNVHIDKQDKLDKYYEKGK